LAQFFKEKVALEAILWSSCLIKMWLDFKKQRSYAVVNYYSTQLQATKSSL